jgi:hypothetical protein
MPAKDPSDRVLLARIAAHMKWAKEPDRRAATAAARKAGWDRFEREVDPDRVLPPEERARRADNARQAYFTRLALKSAQVRRRRRAADRDAAAIVAELDAIEGVEGAA